jgi:pectate lyase
VTAAGTASQARHWSELKEAACGLPAESIRLQRNVNYQQDHLTDMIKNKHEFMFFSYINYQKNKKRLTFRVPVLYNAQQEHFHMSLEHNSYQERRRD